MVGEHLGQETCPQHPCKDQLEKCFRGAVPGSEKESYASETLIYTFTQAYILTDVLTLEHPPMSAHTCTHMPLYINLFYILFPLPGQN